MFSQALPANSNSGFTGNPNLDEGFYISLLFYDPVTFPQETELKFFFFTKTKSDPQK